MEDILSTLVVFLAWFFPLMVLVIARGRTRRARKELQAEEKKEKPEAQRKRYITPAAEWPLQKKQDEKPGLGMRQRKKRKKERKKQIPSFAFPSPAERVKSLYPDKKKAEFFTGPGVKDEPPWLPRWEEEHEVEEPSAKGLEENISADSQRGYPGKEDSPRPVSGGLHKLSVLKKAVIWREILGPPKAFCGPEF